MPSKPKRKKSIGESNLVRRGLAKVGPNGKLIRDFNRSEWNYVHALKDLDSASPELREAAVLSLGRLNDSRHVPSLVHALSDSNPVVRKAAVQSLSNFSDPRAVSGIVFALEDTSPMVRSRAARALGRKKGRKIVPALSHTLLNDAEPDVRTNAAHSLGNFSGKEAVSSLSRAINDADSMVWRNAIESLGKIGGEEAVSHLLNLLKSQDTSKRFLASRVLAEAGSESTVISLSEMLRTEQSSFTRLSAANALGKLMSSGSHARAVQKAWAGIRLPVKSADRSMPYSIRVEESHRFTDGFKDDNPVLILSDLSGKYPVDLCMLGINKHYPGYVQYVQGFSGRSPNKFRGSGDSPVFHPFEFLFRHYLKQVEHLPSAGFPIVLDKSVIAEKRDEAHGYGDRVNPGSVLAKEYCYFKKPWLVIPKRVKRAARK